MGNGDKFLEKLIKENEELAQLVKEHRSLDQKIAKIEKRNNLTMTDEMARRSLKKKKLSDRDRIAAILSDYRKKIFDQALSLSGSN